MRTADFDFDLPRDLIAQQPADPRDSARLLEVSQSLRDLGVSDLPGLLMPGDLLVMNDTRVIPARLTGTRGQAKIEVTLHRRLGSGNWRAFARPARRLRAGDRIIFGPAFSALVAAKHDGGEVTLEPSVTACDLPAALHEHGAMPLPPYINRKSGPHSDDLLKYQTVYATHDGAVAAPTAGLHFTEPLFSKLDAAGVGRTMVTLHVGAGTFLPVTADRAEDHIMQPEWGTVSRETAAAVNAARAAGGRIVAVGSTPLRLLETAARGAADTAPGPIAPFEGETDLFIL
ncbi:MAG: S-adenosylmethionine:tRNA ribosyltransferase-isomerase, partial [Alphaproteobacteria bacterium]|nr:S-adenosylmethionine:tRNA ribosyltransferase-isomerase [Alphaproteobacteria bacterium]